MLKFFILLMFSLSYLMANQTLLLEEEKPYEVLPYSQYHVVEQKDALPMDIAKDGWQTNKHHITFNTKDKAYWVRIKVKNNQNIAKELYLMDERRYVYSLDYFLVKNATIVEHKKDGFYVKENVSAFNSSLRILPLFLEANEEATIFFKVQNYNMLDMPFKIVTQSYLMEYLQRYSFLQGAFFFVLLVMVLYNLITYFIVKIKAYLYYLSYVFFLLIYQASYFGYLKVSHCDPQTILSLMVIGVVGFVVFSVTFVKELFYLKQYLPRLNRAFILLVNYFIFLVILDLIIIIVVKEFYWAELVFNLLNITVPVYVLMLLYALYYLSYKKVNKIVLAYTLLWSIVSLLGLALVGMHSGVISTSIHIDYFFQIAMFFETILFSLMLSYRIKEIEQEKQNQEVMLIKQSRLASMGEIISTIAHQWRQPLSQINGTVLNLDIDYRKRRLTSEVMEKHLVDIETTTAYMSATIDDFMNFFNSNKKLEEFFFSTVVNEAIRLTKMSSAKQVKIYIDFDDILLLNYKSELLQAFLILINNGIDAYDGEDIVKIEITAKVVEKDFFEVSITDNGIGISGEVLAHMFEPYYTTKHKSEGTGLGLYILKMIIENGMDGSISVKNNREGTTFILKFPKKL